MPTDPTYYLGAKSGAFDLGGPMFIQVNAMFKHCLDLLREDIPRLRWRFNGMRILIYTPENHGTVINLWILWIHD